MSKPYIGGIIGDDGHASGVFSPGGLSNPGDVPSLELNFDGQLSSYTRATTSPTATKANGDQLATEIVTQNKTGTVQSKYMGPNGKLINGYVDNLVPHSTDFSTSAGWTHGGTPSLTTGQADPFGGTNATTIGDTNNAGYSLIEYTASLSDDLVLTASIFIKKQSQTNTDQVCLFRLRTGGSGTGLFDLQIKPQDGSYNLVDWVGVQPANFEATREDYGDWWRFSVTAGNPNITTTNYLYQFYPDVGTSFANFGGAYDNSGTGAVTIFGAQFEVAGSPSQYVSSTASPAQVPRVEYDASGNPLGLLVEEARTNTVPNTEILEYTNSYTSLRMANDGHTVTTNAGTAPDGTSSATLIAPGNSNAYYAGHAQGYTAGTTYTFSIYVKVPSGSTFDGQVGFLLYGADFNSGGGNINAYWNLETDGTASFSSSANNPEDYGIIDAGNGWYRIWVTETCTNSVTSKVQQHFRVKGLSATNYATDTLLQWGAQIEEGAGPTSLIAANSTRTADDITLATSNFGYNRAASSVFVDFSMGEKGASNLPGVFRIDDGTNTNNEVLYYDTTSSQLTYQNKQGTSTSFSVETGVSLPFSRAFAVRASGTEARAAIDGVLGSAQTLSAAPSTALTTIQIGRQQASQLNGHIRRFTFFPRAISDASLMAYTGANRPTDGQYLPTRKWGGILGSGDRSEVVTTASVAGDADWNSVELLMDGSSTTVDASPGGNNVVTVQNTVSTPTVTGPYGTSQKVLDFTSTAGRLEFGNNADLRVIEYGAGVAWTVETWFKTSVTNTQQYILGCGGNAGDFAGVDGGEFHLVIGTANNISTRILTTAGDSNVAGGSNLTDGNWHHVAVVYTGANLQLYVDGSLGGAANGITPKGNTGTHPNFNIGDNRYPAQYGFYDWQGYLADFRITKGVARYSGAFTPATSAFPQALPIAGSTTYTIPGIATLAEHYQSKL